MSTEPATMNWRDHVGRFTVEFEVANHEDVVQAKKGFLPPEQVRRVGFRASSTRVPLG